MRKLLTILLLLLATGFSTTTTRECVDSNTLQVNTTYDNGAVLQENIPCEYGCENGTCVDPTQQLNFLKIATATITVLTFFLAILAVKTKTNIRLLFFLSSIILLISLCLLVGVYGNKIGVQQASFMSSVAYGLAIVFTFIIIGYAINYLHLLNRNGGEEDEE